MKIRPLIIAFITAIPIYTSCAKDSHQKYDLTGKWICAISSPNIQGAETIQMSADSSLVINDRICYTSSSKRLKISVLAQITNNGQWLVRNDSLIFTLDKTRIDVDSTSFSFSILQPDSSKTIVEEIKTQMKHEFCTAVSEELKTTYDAGNRKILNLGKIVSTASNSLIVSNDRVVTTFQYVQDRD